MGQGRAPAVAPTIETARLRLRAFRADDLPAVAAIMGDPAVMRHIGGVALGREESWRRMCGLAGLWQLLGYGYWAAEEKASGRLIGQVGFSDFHRDLEPRIEGMPEMGWILSPAAQGQGFGLEAVEAALAWADRTLGPREVPAIIDPMNAPSIRLAEKAGFTLREDASYRGEPILLFRRPAP
jgi:RimJ/RimL family protein N-acetyltransferase